MISPHRAFLAVGSLLGLAFALVIPPLMAPDEVAHFLRAIQVSELRFTAPTVSGYGPTVRVGGLFPGGVHGLIMREILEIEPVGQVKTSWDRVRSGFAFRFEGLPSPDVFENTAVYPPVSYAPQAVAIALVRALHGSVLASAYLGRLLNLACYLALVSVAIRRTPVGATALAVVALLPMALSQAASLSADSLIMACGFLVVVLGLIRSGRSDRATLILRIACGFVLIAGKPVYAPLLFLGLIDVLLRKRNRFDIAAELMTAAAPLVAEGAWLMTLNPQIISIRRFTDPLLHIDRRDQAWFVLEHPFRFVAILWNNLTTSRVADAHMFVGVLGSLSVVLQDRWYLFAYALLIISLFVPDMAAGVRPAMRAVAFLSAATVVIAIHLALYLDWSVVGSPVIDGFQGRYLIPVAPAFVMAIAVPLAPWRGLATGSRLACFAGTAILGVAAVDATLHRLWVL